MFDSAQSMHQVTSPQETDDHPSFVPVGLQNSKHYLIQN